MSSSLQNQNQLAILMYCISWFLPVFKGTKKKTPGRSFCGWKPPKGFNLRNTAGLYHRVVCGWVAEECRVGLHHSTGPRIISQAGIAVAMMETQGNQRSQVISFVSVVDSLMMKLN